jgi:hypothetical protein
MADALPDPVDRLLRAANANDAEFIGKRVSLAVRDVEQRAATTVVTAEVGGDGFNGPSHFSFELDGDRGARMTIRA